MNKLCESCRNNCKQTETARVLECKKYRPVPVQMVIKFKSSRTNLVKAQKVENEP